MDDLFSWVPGTRLKVDDLLVQGQRTAILAGPWMEDYTQIMAENGLRSVSLNFAHGWDGDTSFLPSLQVEGIHILAGSRKLNRLELPASLKHLALDATFTADCVVSGSPALESLRANWQAALTTIVGAAAHLQSMTLWGVTDADRGDVFGLQDRDALEDLELIQATFASTRELARLMPPRDRLTLSYLRRCPDLTIDPGTLQFLELDQCPQFHDLEEIGRHLPISASARDQRLRPPGATRTDSTGQRVASSSADRNHCGSRWQP